MVNTTLSVPHCLTSVSGPTVALPRRRLAVRPQVGAAHRDARPGRHRADNLVERCAPNAPYALAQSLSCLLLRLRRVALHRAHQGRAAKLAGMGGRLPAHRVARPHTLLRPRVQGGRVPAHHAGQGIHVVPPAHEGGGGCRRSVGTSGSVATGGCQFAFPANMVNASAGAHVCACDRRTMRFGSWCSRRGLRSSACGRATICLAGHGTWLGQVCRSCRTP